jgi:hypothetical protein
MNCLPKDLCDSLLRDFLKTSWGTVKTLVEKAVSNKQQVKNHRTVNLFRFANGKRVNVPFEGNYFFLRGSVEYTNPQLTVEEVQGVIGTRLLEACGNHFTEKGLHTPIDDDIAALYEALQKPPQGYIVPFLLNTDDVEADRYSMNPLKQSLVKSGQSAFPAAYVKTDRLKVDEEFVRKYDGTLISKGEAELIKSCLSSESSYLDFVDKVKYSQLEELSRFFRMNLSLYALRMPISTLQAENKDGLLHYIISESHRDYEAISEAYTCMGRSMTKRTTLLTIPHSKKGYGSKRAARGRIHFADSQLQDISVKYKDTKLYPNAVDPEDIAVAEGNDDFSVSGEKLSDYSFKETPSSPQFFLYSIGSPEDAALWHGVGEFASSQLLQSYTSARKACKEGKLIKNIQEKFGIKVDVPLQFNLAPEGMWSHPVHRNIDASIGSVENVSDLAVRGMRLEYMSRFK